MTELKFKAKLLPGDRAYYIYNNSLVKGVIAFMEANYYPDSPTEPRVSYGFFAEDVKGTILRPSSEVFAGLEDLMEYFNSKFEKPDEDKKTK